MTNQMLENLTINSNFHFIHTGPVDLRPGSGAMLLTEILFFSVTTSPLDF